MYVTVVTLSCALLAQATADAPLVSVEPTESRTSSADLAPEAADLIAEALTMPDGAAVTGLPMTLLQALSSVRGGQERSPLARAAGHADQRLRFAAIEAIMKLAPGEPFAGSMNCGLLVMLFAPWLTPLQAVSQS